MNPEFPDHAIQNHIIGNKYKIQECISEGSFGCVFKGIHIKKKNEIVAIKIEKTTEMKSLKHETKILNYLYTNKIRKIPAIYWYGMCNHLQCIVLTFYECSLAEYMTNKYLDYGKINRIMTKMVDIISQIHGKYVVHRDLKPANFMVKAGELFLIDFGLATFYIDDNQTHVSNEKSETIIGTPRFMSIWILEGNRYSRRDDIISLGYIYVSMLLYVYQLTSNQDNSLNNTPWESIDLSNSTTFYEEYDMGISELNINHIKNKIRHKNRILSTFLKYIPNIPESECEYGCKTISHLLEYIYNLKYDELPLYDYINKILLS
jgi:serine/threonine protein kinase